MKSHLAKHRGLAQRNAPRAHTRHPPQTLNSRPARALAACIGATPATHEVLGDTRALEHGVKERITACPHLVGARVLVRVVADPVTAGDEDE